MHLPISHEGGEERHPLSKVLFRSSETDTGQIKPDLKLILELG